MLQHFVLFNTAIKSNIVSPLQDQWRVGLAVARVVDMDGVSTVGSELAQCSLAATHALRQAAACACYTKGE